MKSGGQVVGRVNLDNSAQFPSFRCWVSSGLNFHFIDVVKAWWRCEGGRPVFEHGNTIDDVLHLVLGSTRMKDAIGFQRPSGLVTDNVNECS